jgi:hypothetical protein
MQDQYANIILYLILLVLFCVLYETLLSFDFWIYMNEALNNCRLYSETVISYLLPCSHIVYLILIYDNELTTILIFADSVQDS